VIIQNPLPAYAIHPGKPRGWYTQVTPTGFQISKHKRRHAPAGPWPPGTGSTVGLQHPADSNRQFHANLFAAWKNILTGPQRIEWAYAANERYPKNNKGLIRPMTPYSLFVYENTAFRNRWYTPPNEYRPNSLAFAFDPFNPNVTPNITRGFLLASAGPTGFTYTVGLADFIYTVFPIFQISNTHTTQLPAYNSQFSTIIGPPATWPGAPGIVTITAAYRGIIEIPPRPGIRQIRITLVLTGGPDYGQQGWPTDWEAHPLDLSIPFP